MARDKLSGYYDVGGIETLDIIKAKLTPEQFSGYLLGNSIKYSCRMMFKTPNPLRDAEKTANYSQWHLDFIRERNDDKKERAAEGPISRDDSRAAERVHGGVEDVSRSSSSN